jgi:hypothetical protein
MSSAMEGGICMERADWVDRYQTLKWRIRQIRWQDNFQNGTPLPACARPLSSVS